MVFFILVKLSSYVYTKLRQAQFDKSEKSHPELLKGLLQIKWVAETIPKAIGTA